MLTGSSSRLVHSLQNLILIALSIATLPLSTSILCFSFFLSRFLDHQYLRQRHVARSDPDFKRRRVLITGVGMTKGLALARLFHQAGHDVVGADFEPGSALVCGRVSRAVDKFYRLSPPSEKEGSAPYLRSLVDLVVREKIDLWVSCSGVASAVEDGMAMQVVQAKTRCKAVQFDAKTTQMLHEKHTFIARVQELGLPVPDTHEVTSARQVEDVLKTASKTNTKYILKTIGVDDSVRADMTLLPKDSGWKDTTDHIAALKISESTPWIAQQYIAGLEFCTHALIIAGQVKVFVACPSAELLMHYEALPPQSALSRAMLDFTRVFASKSNDDDTEFTGHLSFDFLVEYQDLACSDPADITLYPIECNPRAHTAVALFNDVTDVVDAYISILDAADGTRTKPTYADVVDPDPMRSVVVVPAWLSGRKFYWVGHDLITKLVLPLVDLVLFRASVSDFVGQLDSLLDHLLTWSDGTWVLWDPLPWWWLYQVYWPLRFWQMFWRGRKWSRINVSTGKMFEC